MKLALLLVVFAVAGAVSAESGPADPNVNYTQALQPGVWKKGDPLPVPLAMPAAPREEIPATPLVPIPQDPKKHSIKQYKEDEYQLFAEQLVLQSAAKVVGDASKSIAGLEQILKEQDKEYATLKSRSHSNDLRYKRNCCRKHNPLAPQKCNALTPRSDNDIEATTAAPDSDCFGAVGYRCEGSPFAPVRKLNNLTYSVYVSVGSIMHDNCCARYPFGQMCTRDVTMKMPIDVSGWGQRCACAREWRKAVSNVVKGRTWKTTIYRVSNMAVRPARRGWLKAEKEWHFTTGGNDETHASRLLKAPAGTKLDCPLTGDFRCVPGRYVSGVQAGDSLFCESGVFSSIHIDGSGRTGYGVCASGPRRLDLEEDAPFEFAVLDNKQDEIAHRIFVAAGSDLRSLGRGSRSSRKVRRALAARRRALRRLRYQRRQRRQASLHTAYVKPDASAAEPVKTVRLGSLRRLQKGQKKDN